MKNLKMRQKAEFKGDSKKLRTMSLFCINRYLALIPILLVSLLSPQAYAKEAVSLALPDNPNQSIKYWKPQVIDPENDERVALAHSVFTTLLRAWDVSRVEPSLNVVKSSAGPWAASLADGNILLSRKAIDICFQYGQGLERDLLAFVLAHELSHQKTSDLWHLKFFRLIGDQTAEVKSSIVEGLDLNQMGVKQIENAEAQADNEAVVMMATLGFNPQLIVNQQDKPTEDFYTYWVENIWQKKCDINKSACAKAQARALRTRAQLESVANQSTLYELGVQAMVAGQYAQARRYFSVYGHNFPSRAVHSSIGVAYLAEAIQLKQENASLFSGPQFYYPLFLDLAPGWQQENKSNEIKRGSSNKIKQQVRKLSKQAHAYFEKAQRLAPEHQGTAFLLAMSYLMMENSAMTKGIVQGQYQPIHGKDLASEFLLALSDSAEGDLDKGLRSLKSLMLDLQMVESRQSTSVFAISTREQLIYAIYYNVAALSSHLGDAEQARSVWKAYAQQMSKQGKGMMFQLALQHLNSQGKSISTLEQQPLIQGMRLGDKYVDGGGKPSKAHSFLLEGEPLQLYRFSNGANYVVDRELNIISIWQQQAHNNVSAKNISSNKSDFAGIKIGDGASRPLQVLGVPTRRMDLLSGQYLAYDNYGFAFLLENDQVSGWFLY